MQANYDDALRWVPKDFNSNYASGSEAEMYSHYIPRVFSQNMHYMPPTTIPYTKPVAVGTVEVNPAGIPRGFASYGGRTQSYESFAHWRQQVQQCVHSTTQSARSSNNRVPGINKDQEEKKDGEDSWGLLDAQAAFLGPTLWDKNLLYDADVKKNKDSLILKNLACRTLPVPCEFMDLDEFLMENGIPINDGSSNALSNPDSPPPLLPTVVGASPASSHGEALCSPRDNHSVKSNLLSPNTTTAVQTLSTSSEREALSFDDGDSNFSHSSMASSMISSSYDCEPAANTSRPRRTTRKAAKDLSTVREDLPMEVRLPLLVDTLFPPSNLAMVESVPGHDFDPRERAFTDDELKPQPMSKKSRKQLVPDEQKDDRYWARRRKNNMAAKRSRDARRLKENQIVIRASYLERENTVLKMELERMRKENEMLRERLSKKK